MADPDNSPMRRSADADVLLAMRKVYRRLERWRKKRKHRERIPETLWTAAGELAREHGVNQVSRVQWLVTREGNDSLNGCGVCYPSVLTRWRPGDLRLSGKWKRNDCCYQQQYDSEPH
jgi:hypothetical protein